MRAKPSEENGNEGVAVTRSARGPASEFPISFLKEVRRPTIVCCASLLLLAVVANAQSIDPPSAGSLSPALELPGSESAETMAALGPAAPEQESEIARTNELLTRLVRDSGYLLQPNAAVEAIAVIAAADGPHETVLRFRVGWVQWVKIVPSISPGEADSAALQRLRGEVDLSPLRGPVVTREVANRRLQEWCNASLEIRVPLVAPEDYRRASPVIWDAQRGALVVEAWTEVDPVENRCLNAAIDLLTGEVFLCSEVVCRVE